MPLLHTFVQTNLTTQLSSLHGKAHSPCASPFGLASEASLAINKGTAASLQPQAAPQSTDGTTRGNPCLLGGDSVFCGQLITTPPPLGV